MSTRSQAPSSAPPQLAAFPVATREAYARWREQRDIAALDQVILAIVAFHRPHRETLATPDDLPDSAALIAHLGFDSLALAEVVFFIEDLFRVTISSAELHRLVTVADLRAYVRSRVAG